MMREAKTLVCFALKEEAVTFRQMADGRPDVAILVTGIGRNNAEKSIQKFLNGATPPPASLTAVLTCGFAGGLNPELQIGQVTFQTEDENLRKRLLAAGATTAKFHFADRIATTVAEKKQLSDRTGCDAVEMESGAIVKICGERDLPCATVRVISDTAGEDLPLDFNALAKPDQSLDFRKLMIAVLKSPGKIRGLMDLKKKTKAAEQQLAAVLAKVIFP